MDKAGVLPPGEGPHDPAMKEIDAVALALDRVRTHLRWIDEHQSTFVLERHSNPDKAERQLAELAASTQEARKHLARLTELLLAGYGIDRSKRLPNGLMRNT